MFFLSFWPLFCLFQRVLVYLFCCGYCGIRDLGLTDTISNYTEFYLLIELLTLGLSTLSVQKMSVCFLGVFNP